MAAASVTSSTTSESSVSATKSTLTGRRVEYAAHGEPADVLTIVDAAPVRSPGPNDVVVRVCYAAINPVDSKVARGFLSSIWDCPLPFSPGYDFSGEIAAVGSAVSGFSVGDAVCGVNWGTGSHKEEGEESCGGAFAEFLTIPAARLSKKPASLSHKQAAAFPLVATTAHQSLFAQLGVQAGERILILGGAGAVGSVAIQLAKRKGAHVTTTASARTRAFVEGFGPDRIIDYRAADWSADEDLKGVDAVFDAIGEEKGFERAKKVLKEDGRFLSIASSEAGFDPKAHPPLQYASFFVLGNDAALQDELAALVASGDLKVPIDEEFAMNDSGVKAMFAKQDGGASMGKNVLKVGAE